MRQSRCFLISSVLLFYCQAYRPGIDTRKLDTRLIGCKKEEVVLTVHWLNSQW